MKRIFLVAMTLCYHVYGSACTIIPDPFCRTLDEFPDHIVLTGIIVGIDTTGIDIEILEILRGEESREIIRVWDGTDFECNGLWSMAASDIGNLYDTVIVILPLIVQQENTWDVIGDYRRPNPYSWITEMDINGGTVEGFISGDYLAPPEYNLFSMNYDTFKNYIITDGDCSSILLADKDVSAASSLTVNNPFASHLLVQFDRSVSTGYLKLYSLTGSVVLFQEIHSASFVELAVQDIPSGMYLMEVNTPDRREMKKLIKEDNR